MIIHFLPLSISGAADLETGDIYLSQLLLNDFDLLFECLCHELSHIILGHGKHDQEWESVFGLTIPNKYLDSCSGLCFNVGNITGTSGILTDYHLLQAYRRSSAKVLGTEGHWEVLNETDGGGPGEQLIRLYPTPKGSFPVVVVYIPVVNQFRSPQAKLIAHECLLAETKLMVGAARRKLSGIPLPDGSTLSLDGESLIAEGTEAKSQLIEKAIQLGEPMPIVKM